MEKKEYNTFILEKKSNHKYTSIDLYILKNINENIDEFINQTNINLYCKKYGFSVSSFKRFICKYNSNSVLEFKLFLQSKLINFCPKKNINSIIYNSSIGQDVQEEIIDYVNNITKVLNYVNWNKINKLIELIKQSKYIFINSSNEIFRYDELKFYCIKNNKHLIEINQDSFLFLGENYFKQYSNKAIYIMFRYKKPLSKLENEIITKLLSYDYFVFCLCDKSLNFFDEKYKISINNIDSLKEKDYLFFLDSFNSVWSIINKKLLK